MTGDELDEVLDAAVQAAVKAGSFLKADFSKQETKTGRYKTENDTLQSLTDADLKAEKLILGELKEKYPNHSYFSEEVGDIKGEADYLWVIDPLDGTSNYARRIPFFCVSIALAYKGDPVAGVVYQPMTEDLFMARKNGGAYLNGQLISVSREDDLSKVFISLDKGKSMLQRKRLISLVSELSLKVRSMRMPGTSAMQSCYVACGKFDAAVYAGLSFYDFAAASVITSEAGARPTDFKGGQWQFKDSDIIICNEKLNRQLAILAFQ